MMELIEELADFVIFRRKYRVQRNCELSSRSLTMHLHILLIQTRIGFSLHLRSVSKPMVVIIRTRSSTKEGAVWQPQNN